MGRIYCRIVLLRARHGLSSGVVLRSVLTKFSLDYDACVAVLSGTLEVIASHISVGTVGSRCITVMTQQQYQGFLCSLLFHVFFLVLFRFLYYVNSNFGQMFQVFFATSSVACGFLED